MAIPLVRSNIVIFFISMSLVLTLALGVYASNRLLTHWLLIRGLEQTFLPHAPALSQALHAVEERTKPPPGVAGLRLSPQEPRQAQLPKASLEALKNLLSPDGGRTAVLDAAVVVPG